MGIGKALLTASALAALAVGGVAFWLGPRPNPRVWLPVHALKPIPGTASQIDLEAWIPAEPDFARFAAQREADLRGKPIAACGNYCAAQLTYEGDSRSGSFQMGPSVEWSSELLQRFTHKRTFAAHWMRAEDGTIRVVTGDPLTLQGRGPFPDALKARELWVQVEIPARGPLRAVSLGNRSSSGSIQPITF